MKMLPVLIVEDDQALREALCDTLALAGYEVLDVADGASALQLFQRQQVGLVVSDVQMQPMDGHVLLQEIKRGYPHIPVLLMTAYGVIDKAVAAMRAGACGYLTKPFEPEQLLAEVARYMLPASMGEEGGDIIAHDPRTRGMLLLAQRVAATNATVMITGESGVGKEIVARYLHHYSPRAANAFIALNCAAIPENLLESILFGHEKGAFTGAVRPQIGKFEQAQNGTLLLDEVSEMPLPLQAKLLRVLQEREVERIGSRHSIALDVRVIATANRNMEAAVSAGKFREDLYYRLNVFPLLISPLRERRLDIVPLAKHFIRRLAAGMDRHGVALSTAASEQLTLYSWPGNIRELENVIQRAMILAPGRLLETEHLLLPSLSVGKDTVQAVTKSVAVTPVDMKSLERAHILDTLATVNGSRKLAASKLGISERTLRYRLQQYRNEDAHRGVADT